MDRRETPGWEGEVLRLTHGSGADQAIEVGGAGSLPRTIRSVRSGGLLTLVGGLDGNAPIDFKAIIAAGIVVRGVTVGSTAMLRSLGAFCAAHDIHPAIDRTFAFDDAPAALAHLASGDHVGKIVIRIP